jgi:hypothetical protein
MAVCTVSRSGDNKLDIFWHFAVGVLQVVGVSKLVGRNRRFPLSCPSEGVFIERIARSATNIAPGDRIEVIH